MIIKVIDYNSREYTQMVALRISTLLEPIGIPAHYIVPEKEKNDLFIAAFEETEMIGCCVLTKQNDETVQLRQMAVLPSKQANGVGSAIIQFAEKKARENTFTYLMMHARSAVINFYKNNGYHIVGNEFFEVGISHYTMQKKL